MEPFHSRRAFTLIELLVVTAIIGVLSLVVVVNQGSFNRTFMLANTSYDIALTLRNAQTFGMGSRSRDGSENAGYGIHFDKNTPKSFILFADIFPGSGSG